MMQGKKIHAIILQTHMGLSLGLNNRTEIEQKQVSTPLQLLASKSSMC